MKNFKKILVLALVVIMCLTALSVTAFAEPFNPTVSITARFNETGDRIIASVVTTEPAGAIQGTLTYSSGLTFDSEKTKFSENNNMEKHVHDKDNKTIKFVLLADDLTKGDTHWADFYFEVPDSGSVSFALTNVSVCDVNENLSDNGIVIKGASLELTANDLTTLGAQHRKAVEDEKIEAALRFGTRLDRNQETNALSEGKIAIRCGFIAGFEFKLGGAELKVTDFDTKTGEFSAVTPKAINIPAKKCLKDEEEYLIYTYAVVGFDDTKMAETNEGTKLVKDLPIVARPYVIYVEDDGETYGIDYGAPISKSYTDVTKASGLIDNTAGSVYGN